jgi:hypothetical protein
MLVVGLLALNFAAARALFAIHLLALVGGVPIGLALQAGLFRLIVTRGHPRNFWIGFVTFGSLALTCFVWAMLTPPTGRRQTDPSDRMTYYSTPGSALWRSWDGYFDFAVMSLDSLPGSYLVLGKAHGEIPTVTVAVISFVPQLLIALLAGLMARLLGKCCMARRRGGRDPAPAPRRSMPLVSHPT